MKHEFKNPIDYTPKALYYELDAQIKADRNNRLYSKIFFAIAFVIGFFGALYVLKTLHE